MITLCFDAVVQLPRCFLHLIVLGFLGHHMIKAKVHLIEITITKEEHTRAQGEKGQPGYRKSTQHSMKAVLQRLADQFSSIVGD